MAHSSYLANVMDRTIRKQKIESGVKLLKVRKFKAAAIVASGISGAIIGDAIAGLLDRKFAIVRKAKENNHGRPVEATEYINGKYVIVDDCIDTGATVKHIIERMAENQAGSKCVGIILHDSLRGGTEFEKIPVYSI